MEEYGVWFLNVVGLDDVFISWILIFKYDFYEGLVDGMECFVCLGEFKVGEVF